MNPTNSVAYQKTEKTKNAARVSAGEKTVRKALNNSAVEKSPAVSSCQMNQSFPGELKWCADEKLVRNWCGVWESTIRETGFITTDYSIKSVRRLTP